MYDQLKPATKDTIRRTDVSKINILIDNIDINFKDRPEYYSKYINLIKNMISSDIDKRFSAKDALTYFQTL